MARTEWFDTPTATTPLSAAMLNDLESRKMEGDEHVFSVKAPPFNAVGNLAADDTVAIQAAIDAAGDVNGTVWFPAGTYRTTAPLVLSAGNGIRLVGAGLRSSIVQNAVTDVFTTTADTIYDTHFSDLQLRSEVGGGHIFQPAVSASTIIARWVFNRVRMNQLNTTKSLWNQVDAGILVGCQWNDCQLHHFIGATVPGFFIKGTSNCCNANRWRGGSVNWSGEYFFWLEQTNATYVMDNSFRDIYAEFCVGGFAKIISGKNTIFDNIQNWDMTVVGASTRDWFYVGKSTSGLTSQFTTFRNCTRIAGALGGGLVDIKLESGNVGRTTISNPHYETLTGYAIDCGSNSVQFEGHSSGLTITNAHTPSVASAAALTLPSGAMRNPGWSRVTGAVTITSMTATFPGHLVTLQFTSATIPQVTDGGNLVLAGNFVSSASQHSTLTLFCDGGTWFEVSRSINS